MQMSPKTVNYGGKKPRFQQRTIFGKNLGFGVGFGYRNNTNFMHEQLRLEHNFLQLKTCQ